MIGALFLVVQFGVLEDRFGMHSQTQSDRHGNLTSSKGEHIVSITSLLQPIPLADRTYIVAWRQLLHDLKFSYGECECFIAKRGGEST
jgi:hypothetical protein